MKKGCYEGRGKQGKQGKQVTMTGYDDGWRGRQVMMMQCEDNYNDYNDCHSYEDGRGKQATTLVIKVVMVMKEVMAMKEASPLPHHLGML